jgi:PTS system fructose-specific IIC component
VHLSAILDPSCVLLDVGGGTRRDVLARLAAPIAALRDDLDGDALVAELVRREEESSTAIADGIAIPHARPQSRDIVTASLGRAPAGVEFDSLDGRPTTLLVLLVSPASNATEHVKWLAHVARVLSDAPTRKRLLEATTVEAILEAIAEREHVIQAEDAPKKAAR